MCKRCRLWLWGRRRCQAATERDVLSASVLYVYVVCRCVGGCWVVLCLVEEGWFSWKNDESVKSWVPTFGVFCVVIIYSRGKRGERDRKKERRKESRLLSLSSSERSFLVECWWVTLPCACAVCLMLMVLAVLLVDVEVLVQVLTGNNRLAI